MDSWFSRLVGDKEEEDASRVVEERLKSRREMEDAKKVKKRSRREAVLASIESRGEEDEIVESRGEEDKLDKTCEQKSAMKSLQDKEKEDITVSRDINVFKPVKIVRSEKRETRYRGSPSRAVRTRIERAKSQRLYMVTWNRNTIGGTFVVLGSTGNVYNVTIGHVNTCSCPDARKGNHCKHIIFVLLKVLQEPSTSPIVWQGGFTDRELDILFRRLKILTEKRTLCVNAVASDAVKRAYSQSTGDATSVEIEQRPLAKDSECPICCELLLNDDQTRDEPVVWCKNSCGNSVHANCMNMWILQKQRSNNGAPVPCPFCRADWQNTGTSTSSNREGYLNLASHSGQSQHRPSYTPYDWRRRWKRRRRY